MTNDRTGTTKPRLDAAEAVEFIRRWTGGSWPGWFYFDFQGAKPIKKPGRDRPFLEHRYLHLREDEDWEKKIADYFEDYGDRYHAFYCVYTLKGKPGQVTHRNGEPISHPFRSIVDENGEQVTHKAVYTISSPGIAFDLDECRKLGLDSDEVLAELRDAGHEFSCTVRTSDAGLQFLFKLDEWLQAENGDYSNHARPILADVIYYFGADFKAMLPQQLLRMPGSLNVKPEYDEPIAVRQRWTDRVFTLDELKKKYAVNPAHVPLTYRMALIKALDGAYPEHGGRHDFAVKLAGTLHRAGVDKASMKEAVRLIAGHFGDEEIEDRVTAAETSYRHPRDRSEASGPGQTAVKTLYEDQPEIHKRILDVATAWMKRKDEYCKKVGIQYTPEKPILDKMSEDAPTIGRPTFLERDGRTFVRSYDSEKEQVKEKEFCNFIYKIRGIVYKSDGTVTWRGEYISPRVPSYPVEVSSSHHVTPAKFLPQMPSGATVLTPNYWAAYIAWKEEQRPDRIIYQKSWYGVINVDTEPEFLFPGENEGDYEWNAPADYDPAHPSVWERQMTEDEIQEYLTDFIRNIKAYHDPKHTIPILGWFAANPISEFVRKRNGGFPTLLVTGIKGSGKSELTHKVMGNHFGSVGEIAWGQTTTMFGIERKLTSSNIVPVTIDEFRNNGDQKTARLQDLIRSLWDRSASIRGRADQTLNVTHLVGNLVVSGQHNYDDSAVLSRTFVVNVPSAEFVNRIQTLRRTAEERGPEAQAELKAIMDRYDWLHGHEHRGAMLHLVLSYLRRDMSAGFKSVDTARAVWEKEQSRFPVEDDRKRKGILAVLSGLILLRRLYAFHGLEELWKEAWDRETMLAAVYNANPAQPLSGDTNASALQTLFDITDNVIMDGQRNGRTWLNVMYVLPTDEEDVAYFDLRRWHFAIRPYVSNGNVAAELAKVDAFENLLRETARRDDSVILGFPSHPIFRQSCVKIDLKRVGEEYRANVAMWADTEPLRDE
jgi:hypothetical protein